QKSAVVAYSNREPPKMKLLHFIAYSICTLFLQTNAYHDYGKILEGQKPIPVTPIVIVHSPPEQSKHTPTQFHTGIRPYRDHSHQPVFYNHLSPQQWELHFQAKGYAEEDILQCIPYYELRGFLAYIKTLQGYSSTIQALYKTYHNASRLKKFWGILSS